MGLAGLQEILPIELNRAAEDFTGRGLHKAQDTECDGRFLRTGLSDKLQCLPLPDVKGYPVHSLACWFLRRKVMYRQILYG